MEQGSKQNEMNNSRKKSEENAESNDSEILINQSIPISKYLVHKNNSF